MSIIRLVDYIVASLIVDNTQLSDLKIWANDYVLAHSDLEQDSN